MKISLLLPCGISHIKLSVGVVQSTWCHRPSVPKFAFPHSSELFWELIQFWYSPSTSASLNPSINRYGCKYQSPSQVRVFSLKKKTDLVITNFYFFKDFQGAYCGMSGPSGLFPGSSLWCCQQSVGLIPGHHIFTPGQ